MGDFFFAIKTVGAPTDFFLRPFLENGGFSTCAHFLPIFFLKNKNLYFFAPTRRWPIFFLIFASPFFKNGRFFYPPHFAPFFFFLRFPIFLVFEKMGAFSVPPFSPHFFFAPHLPYKPRNVK